MPATGDSSEREASHYRDALEEILRMARRGLAGESASLCLQWIEGRAASALGSARVKRDGD